MIYYSSRLVVILAEEIGVYRWTSVPDRCVSTVWKYAFMGFAIIDFVWYNGRHLAERSAS